jgi:hypothetical protein
MSSYIMGMDGGVSGDVRDVVNTPLSIHTYRNQGPRWHWTSAEVRGAPSKPETFCGSATALLQAVNVIVPLPSAYCST